MRLLIAVVAAAVVDVRFACDWIQELAEEWGWPNQSCASLLRLPTVVFAPSVKWSWLSHHQKYQLLNAAAVAFADADCGIAVSATFSLRSMKDCVVLVALAAAAAVVVVSIVLVDWD